MRWKRPFDGETKVKSKFALFPIRIGRETRWLEMVTVKYIYDSYWCGEWKPIEFIDDFQDCGESK